MSTHPLENAGSPETRPAVRRQNQIVFVILQRNIANGDSVREIVGLELGPGLAAVR